MYQHLYSRFLKNHEGQLHFACHSHHFWPDVTRDAVLQAWDDAAKYSDDKWDYLLSRKIPQAQALIAKNLGLLGGKEFVFSQSTHELVYRLLSCFPDKKPIRVLTTDSEFHSFERQIRRLEEVGFVQVVRVPTRPFATFEDRFEAELSRAAFDFVFFSQVFFNSGFLCDANRLSRQSVATGAMTVVDAYHGFMAVPTNLSEWSESVFYLAGSYKYAQGGEGCCFLRVPSSRKDHPVYTGWFAEMGEISKSSEGVPYPEDANRFAGSTMDFTALYRLSAVLDLFERNDITVARIHQHVQRQQKIFLDEIHAQAHPLIRLENLLQRDLNHHGHFFAFEMPSEGVTRDLFEKLRLNGILTDSRKNSAIWIRSLSPRVLRLAFTVTVFRMTGDQLLDSPSSLEGSWSTSSFIILGSMFAI